MMKKKISTFLIALAVSAMIIAQDYKKAFSGSKLELSISNSQVDIEGYDGTEVQIYGMNIDEIPDRAKGLKALHHTGEDNTGIGLSVIESNGVLKIEKVSKRDGDYVIKVPRKMNLIIEETTWNGDGFKIMNLEGDVEVYAKGSDIEFRNVSGAIVAETTNGDIMVVLSQLNQQKQSSIKSTNGFVDITLPADTKADLTLKSTNGDIYTDFDLEKEGYSSSRWNSWSSHVYIGKANGGGVKLYLASINDDVFLRKKK